MSFKQKLNKEQTMKRHLMDLLQNEPARGHMTGEQLVAVCDAISNSERMIVVLEVSVAIEESDNP